MSSSSKVTEILKSREKRYEELAWDILDDMLASAVEWRAHEAEMKSVASDIRAEYAYKMGELAGQRESLIAQLENAFHNK